MQVPDWLPEYGAVSGAALLGSVANAKGSRWRGIDGRIDWHTVIVEGATVIGLSVGIIAFGDWTKGVVDLKVLCGIGVIAGWLGPETVAGFVLEKLGVRKP